MSLKYRIAIIVAVIVASAWALFPRNTIQRVQRSGTFVYDTVKKVPLKLGLDLQGGMHLALEIDESKGFRTDKKAEAIDRALKVVRTRVDQFGVSEPVVQKSGSDRIIVELPGIEDPQRATEVVQKSAFLKFQITDKSGALEKALPRIDAAAKAVTVASAAGTQPRQADSAAPPAALQGLFKNDSAPTDSATHPDSAKTDSSSLLTPPSGGPFSKLIQQGQTPGEYAVLSSDVPMVERFLADSGVRAALPPAKQVLWSTDSTVFSGRVYRSLYVVDARPIITGEYLVDARPNQSPTEGTIVEFQFNREGGRRFQTETAKHIKDFMAIVLDDRVMGRPPVIQSAIGTRGQITLGRGDLQDAQDLALVLRAGALPVPLKVAEVRNIGPSMGKDSIHRGTIAGAIAVLLIIGVLVVYYRLSGVLAVVGILIYVLMTLAMLAGFDAVLTFPGIAGFVLSIGMAVDANVLQFERIREELAHGKSVRRAIDEGFNNSLPAIIDSNVASALTAAVLYQFGTGPVRGFAVTVLAGMISSMFSAVFVVRTLYLVWLRRADQPTTISI